jgi:hypothetical protein
MMQPYGGGAPMGGPMGGPMGSGMAMGGQGGGMQGTRGQPRNPVAALVGSMFCCGIPLYGMLNELKEYTKDESLQPWHLYIPILNLLMFLKLPEIVTRAKQMAGSRNPQSESQVMYILLVPFALAKDLNQVWDPNSGG